MGYFNGAILVEITPFGVFFSDDGWATFTRKKSIKSTTLTSNHAKNGPSDKHRLFGYSGKKRGAFGGRGHAFYPRDRSIRPQEPEVE
jgi:hypothetical protein